MKLHIFLALFLAAALGRAMDVEVKADATAPLRAVSDEAFGINFTQDHANNFTTASKLLWTKIGTRYYRWPGGSDADTYDFMLPPDGTHVSTADFAHLVESQGGAAYVTLNYGSGSPAMAGAFVAYLLASPTDATVLGTGKRPKNGGKAWEDFDWRTAGYWASLRAAAPLKQDDGLNHLRVNHAKPWAGTYTFEFGNEVMAAWENDARPAGHKQDPQEYAAFCKAANALIKSVAPSVNTGIVVIASETVKWTGKDSAPYAKVQNPVTGKSFDGWNPEVFVAMKKIGYTPDFFIDHFYPAPEGQEDDAKLLSEVAPPSSMTDYNGPLSWASRASEYRRWATQYFGEAGKAIYVTNTEHNSCSSNPGKQSTSLVDGLFYADSFGAILQTEIRGFCWWQARSSATNGTVSKSLYGWRPFGDYGLLGDDGYADNGVGQWNGRSAYTPYPTFFAARLASVFADPGAKVLAASSSEPLLSAYACRRTDGKLTLLVVNKSPKEAAKVSFKLKGLETKRGGTLYAYGMGQDTDQSNKKAVDLAVTQVAAGGAAFNLEFAPYSMSVLELDPK